MTKMEYRANLVEKINNVHPDQVGLGRELKSMRQSYGFTAEWVAKKSNITIEHYLKMEAGEGRITIGDYLRIYIVYMNYEFSRKNWLYQASWWILFYIDLVIEPITFFLADLFPSHSEVILEIDAHFIGRLLRPMIPWLVAIGIMMAFPYEIGVVVSHIFKFSREAMSAEWNIGGMGGK